MLEKEANGVESIVNALCFCGIALFHNQQKSILMICHVNHECVNFLTNDFVVLGLL